MKILLINRNNTNTGRFSSISLHLRFTLPLKYYGDYNSKSQIMVLHESFPDLGKAIQWADRIVISRSGSAELLRMFSGDSWAKIIYDVDDNIFIKASYASNKNHHPNNSIYDQFIINSKLVTVSNINLYNIIKNSYGIENIKILPIGVPQVQFNSNPDNNRIVIVNGDAIKMTEEKYKFISEVNYFIANFSNIEIDYIGDPTDDIKAIKNTNFIEKMPYEVLSRFLVKNKYRCAIIPLGGDEDFNLCKSPIKYFQYGMHCIPGLYSKQAVYSDVVINNETGILVDNQNDSWSNELYKIFFKKEIYKNIITNSFTDINSKYTYDKLQENFVDILK
jgi:hypothetical protein